MTGTYTGGNKITGVVNGHRLSGRWVDEDGAWGLFVFDMAADNITFTGFLTYKLTPPTAQTAIETWNGTRIP